MRQRFLLSLYQLSRRYAWWVLLGALTLAILSLFFLRDLQLKSSFRDLLPQGDPILERFEKHQEVLQETEMITILLKLRTPAPIPAEGVARLLEAGSRIEERLLSDEEIVSVSYRQEKSKLPGLQFNLLNFRRESVEALQAVISELQAASEKGTPIGEEGRPLDEIYAEISSSLRGLLSGLAVLNPSKLAEALQELSGNLEELRQLNARVSKALSEVPQQLVQTAEQLDRLAELVRTWQMAIQPPPPDNDEYLLSKDRQALLIQVRPRRSSQYSLSYNRQITQRVKDALHSLDLESLEITWGLKGPYVFGVEAYDALRRDMSKTAIITIVGVLVLFVAVLRRFFYPLLATFPVIIALIFTLVWAKFAYGGLNQLTAFLPAIVLGLGIDYGIQFISHYLEERKSSRRIAPALRNTMVVKGSAMLIAALAASSVLFGLGGVSQTRGLSEMGMIVGLGVLLSCLLTLVLLPSLIVAAHTVLARRLRGQPPRPWDLSPLTRLLVKARWVIFGLVIAGSAAMAWPASRVDFAFISEALMPTNLETLKVRDYIAERFEPQQVPDPENFFLFFVDPSEETVRSVSERLYKLEAVDQPPTSYYSLIYSLIGNPQRREEIKGLLAQFKALDLIGPLERASHRLEALQGQFSRRESLKEALKNLEEVLKKGESEVFWDEVLTAEFTSLREGTQAIIERLEELGPTKPEDQIQVLLVKLEELIAQVGRALETIPPPEEIDKLIENPPAEIEKKFFVVDGGQKKAIVYAHVRPEWLWNSVLYDQFTQEASAIWDDYLGLPMIRATLEGYMERDFWRSTALAIVIILLVLRLDFSRRSPIRGSTWLTLATLALGYLWMLGAMNLAGIDFNVANILISPLLIGLGVDNCVYLLHRHRDLGGRAIERAVASTALPITANTLATMIGFGSLMLAETPVLRVLGETTVMGIGFMTLLSLSFLPAVVAIRGR